MATWELEDELKLLFPHAPAWGQAGFQDQENVRSTPGKDGPGSSNGPVIAKAKRTRRPNPKYTDASWATPKAGGAR
jgi:hypothetical protein